MERGRRSLRRTHAESSWSVVLDDVGAGAVDEVLVLVEPVLQEAAPERPLDLAVTRLRVLPAREPNLSSVQGCACGGRFARGTALEPASRHYRWSVDSDRCLVA